MIWLSLLLSAALLSPAAAMEGNGRAGLIWPGAAALEGGEVAVGGGVVSSVEGDELQPPSAAGAVDLVWGGAGFAVELQSGYGEGLTMSAVGARYLVYQGEHLSLAPWLGTTVIGPAENTGWDVMVAPGVAAQLRGERWGGDLSAPAVGLLLREEIQVLPAVLMGEVGVTWFVTEGASLRLGFGPLLPTVRWRQEIDSFFYEVGVASIGAGFYQGRVGWRF
jgi:hypothetical protein